MDVIESFPFEVVEDPHVWIPLSDGRRLSARIWLPKNAGPQPAVLEYLPYRKRDLTATRDAMTHPWLAGNGYACIRVDIAGTGESEGLFDDEYSEQELSDGVEVIAWIAAQDWCSGAVGVIGISWGGFNGLQLAARRPEALKAVVSIGSTVDRFADDIHFKGGCILGENAGWASVVLGWFSLPPDPEITGEGWREVWLKRMEETPFLGPEWLRHQTRDDYWRHGSVCEDFAAIEAAVLAVSGWHDGYRNTVSHLVSDLKAPVKGIVGPWEHLYPHIAKPAPAIGFLQEMKRWFDRYLRGEANGVDDDPAYVAYLMDGVPPAPKYDERPGRWIAEPTWPAKTHATRRIYLTSTGLFEQEGPCELEVQPDLLCGAATGEYFAFGFEPGEYATDQSADDARCLALQGLPVEQPLDIVGAPRLRLTLAADQTFGQLAVRLSDVAPNGEATLISHGFLNLRMTDGPEAMVDLTPDRAFEAEVVLDQCAYRLKAGHSFRLSLSSSYWPFIWPEKAEATFAIYGGVIDMPLRPLARGDEVRFEPPQCAPPLKTRQIRDGEDWRTVEIADGTGEQKITLHSDSGETENLETGLITGYVRDERWRIRPGDPLSARSDFAWSRTMARGDWNVRVEARLSKWADAENYHFKGDLTAFEGEAQVFHKTFMDSVRRL